MLNYISQSEPDNRLINLGLDSDNALCKELARRYEKLLNELETDYIKKSDVETSIKEYGINIDVDHFDKVSDMISMIVNMKTTKQRLEYANEIIKEIEEKSSEISRQIEYHNDGWMELLK